MTWFLHCMFSMGCVLQTRFSKSHLRQCLVWPQNAYGINNIFHRCQICSCGSRRFCSRHGSWRSLLRSIMVFSIVPSLLVLCWKDKLHTPLGMKAHSTQYFICPSNHRSVLLNTLIPYRSNYLLKTQINATTSTALSDAGIDIFVVILHNTLNFFPFFFF